MLDKFQFKSSGGVYESPNEWLGRLSDLKEQYSLSTEDITAVAENVNLVGFLRRVTEELNGNTVVSGDTNTNVSNNKLGKWGIKIKYAASPVAPDLATVQRLISNNRSSIKRLYFNPLMMAPLGMMGGGAGSFEPYKLSTNKIKEDFKSAIEILKSTRNDFCFNC